MILIAEPEQEIESLALASQYPFHFQHSQQTEIRRCGQTIENKTKESVEVHQLNQCLKRKLRELETDAEKAIRVHFYKNRSERELRINSFFSAAGKQGGGLLISIASAIQSIPTTLRSRIITYE